MISFVFNYQKIPL